MTNLSSISSSSDEALVKLVLKGKKAAWEELYERYFDILFRFSYGYVKSEEIAEDMVQEVFVDLPNAVKKFQTDRRFKTWIFTLTANRCKNYLRNQENRGRLANQLPNESTSQEGVSRAIDQQILKTEIEQVISTCSLKERELYHLRFQMDLSVQEIAETMDIPVGSVKSGLFYLLAKIKAPLKKITDEYR